MKIWKDKIRQNHSLCRSSFYGNDSYIVEYYIPCLYFNISANILLNRTHWSFKAARLSLALFTFHTKVESWQRGIGFLLLSVLMTNICWGHFPPEAAGELKFWRYGCRDGWQQRFIFQEVEQVSIHFTIKYIERLAVLTYIALNFSNFISASLIQYLIINNSTTIMKLIVILL